MSKQYYKITRAKNSEDVLYAEIPEGKKLRTTLDSQIRIWYENIEGGKYRGNGIEAEKVKEVPATGIKWLSFHPRCLTDKTVKKSKKVVA